MDANSHPIRVKTVKGEDFFANSHPYKVTIVGGGGQEARVVDELPEKGEAGYIYLILKEATSEGDIYDEYIWALQQDGETYGWEHIGATNEVKIEIDDALSNTSENAVQNKVIKGALDEKLDKTTTFWGQTVNNGVVNGDISVNKTYFQISSAPQSPISGSKKVRLTLNGGSTLSLEAGKYNAAIQDYMFSSVLAASYVESLGMSSVNIYGTVTSSPTPTNQYHLTNKKYVDDLVVSYSALSGSTAPTTATEAKYIGQLYYDTTNEDLYYCSAITAQGTNPETYEYTWTAMGGGQSVTLYNTYGQNTDGAMTQKATTDLVYTGGDPKKVNIGDNGVTGGTNSIIIGSEDSGTITAASDQIIIGHNITDSSQETIAIGHNASASAENCIVIGRNVQARGKNSIAIGPSNNTWQTIANGSESIALGYGARASGTEGITIGYYAALQTTQQASSGGIIIGGRTNLTGTTVGCSVVIGYGGTASGRGSVALGAYSSTPLDTQGVVGIGTTNTFYGYNNTNYRLLTGLHDGEQDHDAATVGQLNTAIINGGTTAPTTSTVGAVGTLYSYVDTAGTTPTPVLSVCTAVDTTDPSNPTYTWTDLLGPIEQALNQINSGTGV